MGGNCRERERNCPSGIKFRDLSLKRVAQLLPNIGTEVGNAGESRRSGQRRFLTLLPTSTHLWPEMECSPWPETGSLCTTLT